VKSDPEVSDFDIGISDFVSPAPCREKRKKGTTMRGAPLPPIGRSNTALVLHDMQNDFIKASLSRPEMHAVVKRTKALIDLARSLPVPVIYTRVESDPAMTFPPERASYLRRSGPPICVKGSAGAEVIDVWSGWHETPSRAISLRLPCATALIRQPTKLKPQASPTSTTFWVT
jgi:hypothetical protein